MATSDNPAETLGILEAVSRSMVEADDDAIAVGRQPFFMALREMARGEYAAAAAMFRRAARTVEAPLDALALYALGECERVQGREGAAIRTFSGLGHDERAPHEARYFALLALTSLEEARGDARGIALAKQALEALGEPAERH